MTQRFRLAGLAEEQVLRFVDGVSLNLTPAGGLSSDLGHPLAVGVAPGRFEQAGHHTDYANGVVYGFGIDRGTVCVLWKSPSPTWYVMTVDQNGELLAQDPPSYDGPQIQDFDPFPAGHWLRYVFGTIRAFEEETKQSVGGPYAMLLVSNLPMGAGLSSSASLELAIANAFQAATKTSLGMLELAMLCKRAENVYAGLGCGLLDQGVSAFARPGEIVRIDTIEPNITTFPCGLNLEEVTWLVVHSGVKHQLTRTNYAQVAAISQRVNELACQNGEPLSRRGPGFLAHLAQLRKQGTLNEEEFLCGCHVVTSGALAGDMEDALRNGDARGVGLSMSAVHNSLSRLHGVSCAQVDQLQGFLTALPGVYGASMMGGGGGGALGCLVDRRYLRAVSQATNEAFSPPHLLEVSPFMGAWNKAF